MSRTLPGRAALAGAALSLALGLAACGGSAPSDTATAATGSVAEVTPVPATAPEPQPVPDAVAAPTTAAPVATTAAPKAAPPTTAARTRTPPTTAAPVTTPAPVTTAAPVTPTFAPGQRINPSSAQVQAAMATLTQRIPLFKPNESQLKTFADAACTSFDQGQTFTQVSSTIRQAVTYVQGASLSTPDADFAVRTVVTLRCPGYLP